MKASAARDLAVGGPTLAAHAFKAGLADVCHLSIAPITIGDGNRAFPSDIRLELALQDERCFRNGMVYLPIINKPSHLTLAAGDALCAANCSCDDPAAMIPVRLSRPRVLRDRPWSETILSRSFPSAGP